MASPVSIDAERLTELVPQIKPERAASYASALNFVLGLAEVSTPLRLVHFISQLAYESASFKALTENLNYSADRLYAVFPRYFTSLADAQAVANRGAEAVANRVYANRLGNGPPESGDGWRYRGRGFIMLTGKTNYKLYQSFIGLNVVEDPDMVGDPYVAAQAAAFFWLTNGLNTLADRDDVAAVTRRINGGTNGLEGRRRLLARAKSIWMSESLEPTVPIT